MALDDGRPLDWGRTSADYGRFRPGPPEELFARLRALGIGLPGQRILDLGTGTGVMARGFARQGARVAGIDIAPEQVAEARRLSAAAGLEIDFRVAPAEAPPFPAASFDAATANQCFLYFDKARTLAELRRVLAPGGRLVTSHFNWLPGAEPIVAASEALVLAVNPSWQGAGFDGFVSPAPDWLPTDMAVEAFFWFDAAIPFTRDSWRGRIRACRGIGATLSVEGVARFDAAHAELLARIAPDAFTLTHRIDAHILRFQPR